MITASLNNYRQSPRKVRVVATLIKGKKVADALISGKAIQITSPAYIKFKKGV